MNKENLISRIAELEASIQQTNANINQLIANLNALNGAKQESQAWLDKLASEGQTILSHEELDKKMKDAEEVKEDAA